MKGFGSSVPMDTTFDTHERGLERWKQFRDGSRIGRMQKFRTIQALLTLVLLEEEMTPTIPIEGKFPASGLPDALLRAAVGLHLRHKVDGV